MNYIEVAIETKTEAVEAISYLLMEQGVGGVQIEDPKDALRSPTKPTDWDFVDSKLLEKDPDLVTIKAYFPDHMNVTEKIADIHVKIHAMRAYLDVGRGTIFQLAVEEEEWASQWKKYYKITPIGQNIIIKPTWEDYTAKNQEKVIIELDPGMAFGTGTHETTSMCMELLEKYVKKGDTVLDIGTGSGILGITAAKLGAGRVIGGDLDQTAVKVAKENIELNGVSDTMDARWGDLLEITQQRGHVIVANIIADAIIFLTETVSSVMHDNAIFISSGIIDYRVDDVKQGLSKAGFEIIEIKRDGEWAAIVAKKKGD